MAQTVKNTSEEKTPFRIRSLFYMLGGVLFILAVFSHQAGDYSVLAGGHSGVVANCVGNIGARVACNLFLTLGLATYVLAVIVLLAAIRTFLPQKLSRTWLFLPGVLLTLAGSSLLFAYDPTAFAEQCQKLGIGSINVPELSLSGGVIGQVLIAPHYGDIAPGPLRLFLGPVGSTLFSATLLLAGLILLYSSDWHSVLVSLVNKIFDTAENAAEKSINRKKEALLARAEELEQQEEALEKDSSSCKEKPSKKESFADRVRNLMQKSQELDALGNELAPQEEEDLAEAQKIHTYVQDPEPVSQFMQEDDLFAESGKEDNVVVNDNTIPEPAPEPVRTVRNSTVTSPAAPAHELASPAMVESGEKAVKVHSSEYVLPPMTMLSKGEEISGEKLEVIAQNKVILQDTLESFKVNGQVVGHVSGPRVTRYEIRLAPSVKVSKVTEIENNIAMNLKARSLRILAPIPGRDVVGVEVPNTNAEAIMMRSVMESDAWQRSNMEIPIVLGKDISGKPMVLDLAKAPHLLIAGATGSGKSVCMNSLIMSLLMKFSPEDLRLILVDPKVVEMADYQKLPHLITPVIHDSKKVPLALRWATTEMDKRYLWLAKTGVKKLKDFNNRRLPDTPMLDDDGLPIPDKLPVLIVIIDELADLMVTDAKSDIETSISRIAAKGRAAGVHIVVATQRPSRDVITGTIKSNLPTRIAFRVVSVIDSRVILDQKGAESLLGMGDMLLLAPNSAEIERIQGSLVADDDIKEIVKFVSGQREQEFDQQVVASEEEDDEESPASRSGRASGSSRDWTEEETDDFIDNGFELDPMVSRYMQPGDDDLVRRALEIVLLEKKASTSYIQRRLKIGYNRAAELIDLMEERGIVGPPSGSGAKRDILVFDDIINQ